jgi:pimeloyl-ACP methyl ester carboxylesterase
MFWLDLRRNRRLVRSWMAVFCLLGLASCTSISVRHVARPDQVAISGLSPSTQKIAGSAHPAESIVQAMFEEPATETNPAKLLATAELAYQAGTHARTWSPDEAFRWYVACARQTYLMLSSQETADEQTPRTLQLYNAAVAHCLRLAIKTDRLSCQSQILSLKLDVSGPDTKIPIEQVGFYRTVTEFGKLELCEDLQVVGLDRMHSTHGMGVPVLVHKLPIAVSVDRQYEPEAASFPATAIIHFDGPTHSPTRLELANSLTVQDAYAHDQPRDLAMDFTTPLASTVSQSPLERLAYAGFLHSDSVRKKSGIRMLEPYQPGKIPVLFVHGLVSSPITWVPLFNDLLADPTLRKRYQFWSYFYPTADPFPTSSADLRESLVKLRMDLDPDGQDPSFDQLVLVGHSMGGLLCKMMTVDGGDDFWQIVSQQPIDSLGLTPDVEHELRRTFYFERQRNVKRVIFIATPHHGSSLSRGLPGQLANRFVRLRNVLTEANKEMIRKISDLPEGHVLTSVELLAPNSTALKILASQPRPPDVHYHSIIGVESKGAELSPWWLRDSSEKSDGVVSYRSAHLEAAESELIVAAEHSKVQQTVETSREVRMILLEHLLGSQKPGRAALTTWPRGSLRPKASLASHSTVDRPAFEVLRGETLRQGNEREGEAPAEPETSFSSASAGGRE